MKHSLLLLLPMLVSKFCCTAATEGNHDYVYIVFYEDACQTSPVLIKGQTASDPYNVTGGVPIVEDSVVATSPFDQCSYQGSCFLDSQSAQCQTLNNSIVATVDLRVDDFGVIVECDPTNVLISTEECEIITGCIGSSVFPSCNFTMFLLDDLVKNPDFVTNTEPVAASMEDSSYMVFYSDDQCRDTRGIYGVVSGEQKMTIATEASCTDAMACLFNPNGNTCTGIGDKEDRVIWSKVEGINALECDGGNATSACTASPSRCVPSPIPSCHYRWVSSATFLGDAGSFLVASNDKHTESGTDALVGTMLAALGSLLFSLLW